MCMLRGLVKSIASEKVPLHYSIGAGVPNRKQHIAAWLKAKRYVYPGDAVVSYMLLHIFCDAYIS